MQFNKPLPELLSPAGSIETFMAGLDNGADAFYGGLPQFNARLRARNFSNDELSDAIKLAHKNGKKFYLTMNTLVHDSEMSDVFKALEFALHSRADAIIIQDIGLLQIIKKFFPELVIHASTQTFIHNRMQARFWKEAGVSRIILPRELNLAEIKTITDDVPLEYEAFIHGALCFSFSGCCLFSSRLTGDSGNRGRCKQPCRYRYNSEHQQNVYPFSMRDLSAAPFIEELIKSGVSSLKIEGRLKNADYVSRTVSYYRNLLDGLNDSSLKKNEFVNMERELTTGYLGEYNYESSVQSKRAGSVGRRLGEVKRINGTSIVFTSTERLKKGSRLRLLSKKGELAFEGALLDYYESSPGSYTWEINSDKRCAVGLQVFLLGNTAPHNITREMTHLLKNYKDYAVNLDVCIQDNKISITATDNIIKVTHVFSYEITYETARNSGLTQAQIEEIFMASGDYPYAISFGDIVFPENIFVPVARLKDVRRLFFDDFNSFIQPEIKKINESRESVFLLYNQSFPCQSSEVLTIDNLSIVKFNYGTDSTIFKNDIFLMLPVFVSADREFLLRESISQIIKKGCKNFILQNPGQLELFKGVEDIKLFAGEFFYIANYPAYVYYKEMGIDHYMAGPPLPLPESAEIVYPGGYFIPDSELVLMVSRQNLPESSYFDESGAEIIVNKYAEYSEISKKLTI